MRIYSVVSIAQLKPSVATTAEISDSYKRKINKESSLVHNKRDFEDFEDENNTEIERIISKRITREKLEYLLRWKNWDKEA